MTTDTIFGQLVDLAPREAWKHEAHAFTPWLADNIELLSQAVGIPIELEGQEVRVDTFAADILGRNSLDDTIVLIENQLEVSDHTHLGQILTYLSGLDARTVIWISPQFREPHLSAIRWLNQHTDDEFAFFAVRLRVVRIGDSPFAPIFEVLEKPSGWERDLKAAAKSAANDSDITRRRLAYWRRSLERHPDLAEFGLRVTGTTSQCWCLGERRTFASASSSRCAMSASSSEGCVGHHRRRSTNAFFRRPMHSPILSEKSASEEQPNHTLGSSATSTKMIPTASTLQSIGNTRLPWSG